MATSTSTTPAGAPATAPVSSKKTAWTSVWLSLAGALVIGAIAAPHFVNKARSSQTLGNGGNGLDKRERFTADGISYVVVIKGELTLDEGWSSPPIIREPNQGMAYQIIGGKAESYWVKDASQPGDGYPFTDDGNTTICTGGSSGVPAIDSFIWKTGRIIRGPVIVKFFTYERDN